MPLAGCHNPGGSLTAVFTPDFSTAPANRVLGRKLDSIPFSGYHVLIIAVLALVGFIEGYDLVMTGSLLVLAKAPLHLAGPDIKWLPIVFGRETVGQLEVVTETVPEYA